MRLLTAGSLVRAQQGEPNKSTSNDVLFFCLRGFAAFSPAVGGTGRGCPKRAGGVRCKSKCKSKCRSNAGRDELRPPRKSLPRKTRPGKAPARKSPATAKKQRPGQTAGALPLCCEKNQSSRLPNSLRRRSGLCSSAQAMAQGEVNSSSFEPFRSSMRRVSLVRSRFLGSRSSFSIQRMCS